MNSSVAAPIWQLRDFSILATGTASSKNKNILTIFDLQ